MGYAARPAPHRHLSLASVTTYPPTICGIATYTQALLAPLAHRIHRDGRLSVVRLVDRATDLNSSGRGRSPTTGPVTLYEHARGDLASLERTAAVLNAHEVVSLQHEFGIYGGRDGAEVAALIDAVSVPVIVTFHTVLREPTAHQRAIVEHLTNRADASVVMSHAAAERLATYYAVPAEKIEVIPHGFDARLLGPSLTDGTRPVALTWGLIGPGKGLEVAIEAFAELIDLDPQPRYRIAGATHPGEVARSGEAYRRHLTELVASHGLEDIVEFDDRYLDTDTLHRQIRAANLIVLPYLSTEQVTSGVLVEAIGAGKPVVSTGFPHAVEVLASGAGIIVPRNDPHAMGEAIRSVVTDRRAADAMARASREVARTWSWPAVGAQFEELVASLALGRGRFGRARSQQGVAHSA